MIGQHPSILLVLLLLVLPSPTTGLWWLNTKTTYFCGTREEVANPEYRTEHPNHVECMAGGAFNLGGFLSGRYMCRESYKNKWLPWLGKKNETICVATVAGGVIAELGDQCGCCDGSCPQTCTCRCGDDANQDNYHVLVYKDRFIGKGVQCISQGKASRWTAANEDQYECVPPEECYLYTETPTGMPTFEPTWEPTSSPTYEPTQDSDGTEGDDSGGDDFWDNIINADANLEEEQNDEETTDSFGQWEDNPGRPSFTGLAGGGGGEGYARPREEEFP